MIVRQAFHCADENEGNCASRLHGENGGRATKAAKRHYASLVRVVISIGSAVYVSCAVLAAMHMHMAGKTIVQVNRAAQRYRGLRHGADSCKCLRHGNHDTLLQECSHCHQHEAAGKPSQVLAHTHEILLGQIGGKNKATRRVGHRGWREDSTEPPRTTVLTTLLTTYCILCYTPSSSLMRGVF
jgi:hypothetical protein